MARRTNYQADLIEALKDPREAAAYLNAAIEEGDREVFLLALRNVAEANGGVATISEKTHLNRESLYRAFSRRGNRTRLSGQQSYPRTVGRRSSYGGVVMKVREGLGGRS